MSDNLLSNVHSSNTAQLHCSILAACSQHLRSIYLLLDNAASYRVMHDFMACDLTTAPRFQPMLVDCFMLSANAVSGSQGTAIDSALSSVLRMTPFTWASGTATSGFSKLTAKQWTNQILDCFKDRVSDRASNSQTRPTNARTFRALHKWESFTTDVIKFQEALDDSKAIYNPLVRHALDLEDPAVQDVGKYTAPADEQEVCGPLMTTVLTPVSEVAASLGCMLTYTGNGSGRSASFTDLLVKIKQTSSREDLAKLIMAVIKVKGTWQFGLPDDLHLVDALSTGHADRVIEVVQQAFGDAVRNECPFIIITTGKVAHFLKRSFTDPADPDLWSSPPVPANNNSSVPALAAWLYLLFEAEKQLAADGSKRPGWSQSQVPATPPGGYRLVLNNKVVDLNARFPKGHSLAGEHQQPKRARGSSPGRSKHSGWDNAELADAASLTGAFGEVVVVAAGTNSSSSGTSSNQSSNRGSNSSIGDVAWQRPQLTTHNTSATAMDMFDGSAWAQRIFKAAQHGKIGITHAVDAVSELPLLPTTTYSCSTTCLGWSSAKAVYKGKVCGQYDAVCKLFNSRSDLALQQFVSEATAYVALAGQLCSSIIPLLGLGRQPHTGDPMLVLAAGEQLPDSLSQEQRLSAEEALQSIHAAGRLHGDVEPRNMLLFGNRVVMCDLEHSTLSSDAQAFEREVLRCKEVLAHTATGGRSDP